MDIRMHDPTDVTPRRGFFTRIAASAMALGLTGLTSAPARAAAGAEDGPDWPGTLKGRHRQVVDAYAPNDGFPLAFAYSFVAANGPASAASSRRPRCWSCAIPPPRSRSTTRCGRNTRSDSR